MQEVNEFEQEIRNVRAAVDLWHEIRHNSRCTEEKRREAAIHIEALGARMRNLVDARLEHARDALGRESDQPQGV